MCGVGWRGDSKPIDHPLSPLEAGQRFAEVAKKPNLLLPMETSKELNLALNGRQLRAEDGEARRGSVRRVPVQRGEDTQARLAPVGQCRPGLTTPGCRPVWQLRACDPHGTGST